MTENTGLDVWAAPVADSPVTGSVTVPGSKSMTNRALILASLADGRCTIPGALRSRDTELMAGALRALGTEISDADHEWRVTPRPLHGPAAIDCGLAGTVMRFVPPVAALARGDIVFDGDPAARRRPMDVIINALRTLGAVIDDDRRYALPFTVRGQGALPGGEVTIDASTSSQFISGLLLAGARFEHGLLVRHRGAPVPSRPHLDMTVQMLADCGVTVTANTADPGACDWRIRPQQIRGTRIVVEPDLSNAAPFLAAAVATGGSVTVAGWPAHTTQPGALLPRLLMRMGARVSMGDAGLTMLRPGELTGLDVDLHDVGELAPTLAALCVLANTPSRLRGIAHLRGHETDRLAALVTEIRRVGATARETDDGLIIEPGRLRPAVVQTYGDHRMATFAAIIGLVVPGIEVVDIETTAKTMPGFAGRWSQLVSP